MSYYKNTDMSIDKKQDLIDSLSSLNNEDKVWVINFLIQTLLPVSSRRKAKKKRKDEFTDKEWEEYFDFQQPVPLPDETMSEKDLLTATSGKSIKQMEKWL